MRESASDVHRSRPVQCHKRWWESDTNLRSGGASGVGATSTHSTVPRNSRHNWRSALSGVRTCESALGASSSNDRSGT